MSLPSEFFTLRLMIVCLAGALMCSNASAGDVLPPASERFTKADAAEEPSFQRHVLPLMGRLGCNGRACHGSFQGQGGFRLSLFGYDFQADHDALTKGDKPRTNLAQPDESLLLRAVTHADSALKMPPAARIPDAEIEALREWVKLGAPFPERQKEKGKGQNAASTRHPVTPSPGHPVTHWAFRPVRKPSLPGVKNAGCSGLTYTIDFAREIAPGEEVVEADGVKVVIDPKASMYLLGTEIDFVEDKLGAAFKFNNPNEASRCGCGESFTV